MLNYMKAIKRLALISFALSTAFLFAICDYEQFNFRMSFTCITNVSPRKFEFHY